MSLKSMLNSNSPIDKEFQAILREALPSKNQFEVVYNEKAFTNYPTLVPYSLNTSYEAGLVGTAFDYLARAMIAQVLLKGKEPAYMDLKALAGIKRMERYLDKSSILILNKHYTSALEIFVDYIYSNNGCIDFKPEEANLPEFQAVSRYLSRARLSSFVPITDVNELIHGAYFFAKLEHIYRNGGRLPENGIDSLFETISHESEIELRLMCHVFRQRFIDEELVEPDSTVIFNPSFGLMSRLCGGADADIYIDGILIDFKSGKKLGYDWKEIAQIVAYYYLNLLEGHLQESKFPAQLRDYPILKIALYRARYGEIEWCTTDILPDKTIKSLMEHFPKRPEFL